MDAMIDAYMECALWSSAVYGYWNDETNVWVSLNPDAHDETHGLGDDWPIDEYFDDDDIAPETQDAMREDCVDFVTHNSQDLAEMEPAQVGHDFWLTRNGHGAGFRDRGLGELGERLSDAAKVYGSFDLWVGDDGKVCGQ
jgi:hypothetical protein